MSFLKLFGKKILIDKEEEFKDLFGHCSNQFLTVYNKIVVKIMTLNIGQHIDISFYIFMYINKISLIYVILILILLNLFRNDDILIC